MPSVALAPRVGRPALPAPVIVRVWLDAAAPVVVAVRVQVGLAAVSGLLQPLSVRSAGAPVAAMRDAVAASNRAVRRHRHRVAADWPSVTVWLDGDTATEKSGAGGEGGPPPKAARPLGLPRPVGPS